jgi:hypothetical protein
MGIVCGGGVGGGELNVAANPCCRCIEMVFVCGGGVVRLWGVGVEGTV